MDQTQIQNAQRVKVTQSSPFHVPLDAKFRDETVKVTHVGDAQDMSPVYLIVDAQGRSSWVPQSEITFTDSELLTSSSGQRQKAIAGRS